VVAFVDATAPTERPAPRAARSDSPVMAAVDSNILTTLVPSAPW
jgi:hypothetical protein